MVRRVSRPRVLILVTTRSYRASAFLDAAARMDIDVTVATEHAQALTSLNPAGNLTLPRGGSGDAVETIRRFAGSQRLDAVLAADDDGALLAATAASALGLRAHPPEAVAVALDKHLARAAFVEAGLHSLPSIVAPRTSRAEELATGVPYPCVLKPRKGSASRGVIRANDAAEFVRAFRRIALLLDEGSDVRSSEIVIEPYVDGIEVAVEGLISAGRLRTLAIFDKPDPLQGPFFEETIYVTPSRLPGDVQRRITLTVEKAAAALGLTHGPIHAEVRIDGADVWPLEVAPRSIGGLCSQALRFEGGGTLEQVILGHALGLPRGSLAREPAPAGVMMIPVPRTGRLRGVTGLEQARSVPGVTEVQMAVATGDTVVAWPEGNRYLGFIFAAGPTAARVEETLRNAHRLLVFDIETAETAAVAPDPEES